MHVLICTLYVCIYMYVPVLLVLLVLLVLSKIFVVWTTLADACRLFFFYCVVLVLSGLAGSGLFFRAFLDIISETQKKCGLISYAIF